jgi:hypothetical protein
MEEMLQITVTRRMKNNPRAYEGDIAGLVMMGKECKVMKWKLWWSSSS